MTRYWLFFVPVLVVSTQSNCEFQPQTTASVSEFTQGGLSCNSVLMNQHQFVLTLPMGQVFEDGLVFTSDGRLIEETTIQGWGKSILSHPILKRTLPNPSGLSGRVAVLASVGADEYYHWLLQIIARLAILQQSGESYDYLYLMPLTKRFQRDTLELVGINFNKVIFGGDNMLFQASELIVPTVPTKDGRIAPVALSYLRKIFLGEGILSTGRKIYISRCDAKKRRVLNEDALMGNLKPLGFEKIILGELNVQAQARLFAESSVIISPHGSGLANLVFTGPDTHIIEIHTHQGINGLFQRMSRELGLVYTPIQTSKHLLDPQQIDNEHIFLDESNMEAIRQLAG